MMNDEAGVIACFAFTTGVEIADLDLKTRFVKEEKRLLDMSFFRIQDRAACTDLEGEVVVSLISAHQMHRPFLAFSNELSDPVHGKRTSRR